MSMYVCSATLIYILVCGGTVQVYSERVDTADGGLLSLLQSDGQEVSNGQEVINMKYKNLEKVKEIQNVKTIKKIKDLKKIKSMIPIDEDLALKMKNEIGLADRSHSGKETPEINDPAPKQTYIEAEEDRDLLTKVDRILRLFNVTDLDDITKVTPIDSITKVGSKAQDQELKDLLDMDISSYKKKEEGRLHFEPRRVEELNSVDYGSLNPGGKWSSYDHKFEKENEQIRRLDKEIEINEQMILHEKQEFKKEKDLLQILLKMLEMARNKVTMVEEVISEHKGKEFDVQKAVKKVQLFLKEAKVEKIAHLENLKSLAEEKKNEALSDMDYYEAKVDIGKSVMDKLDVEVGDNAKINTVDTDQWVDRSLYKVFPLKSIKTMKKIQSMLELTPEQAEKLRRWQEERNVLSVRSSP